MRGDIQMVAHLPAGMKRYDADMIARCDLEAARAVLWLDALNEDDANERARAADALIERALAIFSAIDLTRETPKKRARR